MKKRSIKLTIISLVTIFSISMFSTCVNAKSHDPGNDEPVYRCSRSYMSSDPGNDEAMH